MARPKSFKVTPKGDDIGQLIADAGYTSQAKFADDQSDGQPTIDPDLVGEAVRGEPCTPKTIQIIAEKLAKKHPGICFRDLIVLKPAPEPEAVASMPSGAIRIIARFELSFTDPNDPRVAAVIHAMAAIAQLAGEYAIIDKKIGSLFVTMEMSVADVARFLRAFNDYRFEDWNCTEIEAPIDSLRPISGAFAILLPAIVALICPPAALLAPGLSLVLAYKAARRALSHTEIILRNGKAVFVLRHGGGWGDGGNWPIVPPEPTIPTDPRPYVPRETSEFKSSYERESIFSRGSTKH